MLAQAGTPAQLPELTVVVVGCVVVVVDVAFVVVVVVLVGTVPGVEVVPPLPS